jgi:hypothetical protein
VLDASSDASAVDSGSSDAGADVKSEAGDASTDHSVGD